MLDSYTLNVDDIISLEYRPESKVECVRVNSMLRDFALISTQSSKLENLNINLDIYVKTSNERVKRLFTDADYVGAPPFGCGERGTIFFDQLAKEREDNIKNHYLTEFLIPFDPEIPLLWLDNNEGHYKLSKPNEEQQIEIFIGYIERIRRL